ncbi:hypothetical protein CVIRNUC_001981 [Coccomyxa viridis]|uniref:Uncharacterized protein n=1 Tax=Coccomyxa viridis TaxID=1274662 RepID=A0AAV1HX73_9CHLO|nr:hypothetical protein CVIRNUC_001981 [Coccomyxa viridis]
MGHGSNGAPKATASVSAGGKPPPFWANWGDQWKKSTTNLNSNAQGWVKGMESRAKTVKMPRWEMPVHVDVDFLNPFITSVKQSALDTWRRLPPQAQLALPFVATGATTGILVGSIQGGRLKRAKARNKELEARVEALLNERDVLKGRVQQLKAKALAPNSASEMRMAHAVAEATAAAAAAASAAASAASTCQVSVQKFRPPQAAPRIEAPRS